MIFALVSIITCLECGRVIPASVVSMRHYAEPDMAVIQCPQCGFDMQIRYGKNENFTVEPLKKH